MNIFILYACMYIFKIHHMLKCVHFCVYCTSKNTFSGGSVSSAAKSFSYSGLYIGYIVVYK